MTDENHTTLIGNITRDPELRYTNSGVGLVKFGLAVNRKWQNRQTNEWEEEVSFFDVVAWQQLAENVGDTLAKGNRAVVVGRLRQRSWDGDDGKKRYATEIVASDIAVSLRYATAEITKNPPKDGYTPEPDFPHDRPPAGSRGGGQRAAAPPADFDDEEPF